MGFFDRFKLKRKKDKEVPSEDVQPKDVQPKDVLPKDVSADPEIPKESPKEIPKEKPKKTVKKEVAKKPAPKKQAKKATPKKEAKKPALKIQEPAVVEPVAEPPQPEPPQVKEPQATEPEAQQQAEKPEKKSWFSRLKSGLGKSAQKITTSLAEAIGKPKLDANDLDDIEDALIMADLGVSAAGRLTEGLKKRPFPDGVTADTLAEALAEEVAEILMPVAKPLTINPDHKPHVVLMVGVNGSGKTTTTGKLAEQWQAEGKTVMLAAADTFRAAAVEQLKIWGDRTGTTVIAGEQGSDAAAVAYQAYETAIAEQADVLIVDTAGRLQAKAELMDELAKICRVLSKKDERAPHDRIIVLDGTVGQNASSQVSAFKETADLSGMIITKLDGSARGGVVVALAEAFQLPIHAVGVGEGKDDLRAFDAVDFGRALAGLEAKS